jgi:ABC-type nitrate/sulfonate/bicarbonate transport system permease component
MSAQGQLKVATKIVMAGMIAIGLVDVIIDLVLRRVEARIRSNWGR